MVAVSAVIACLCSMINIQVQEWKENKCLRASSNPDLGCVSFCPWFESSVSSPGANWCLAPWVWTLWSIEGFLKFLSQQGKHSTFGWGIGGWLTLTPSFTVMCVAWESKMGQTKLKNLLYLCLYHGEWSILLKILFHPLSLYVGTPVNYLKLFLFGIQVRLGRLQSKNVHLTPVFA